jgi:bifunctional non-homologous end joining protein LigD
MAPTRKKRSTRKLREYRAKRDFARTAEPGGDRSIAGLSRLRYVIHKHDATRLHYDLRLELDGVFKSWAVTRGPSLDPKEKRLAVEVEDHPLDYGDFEGTIPKGEYGGGAVQIWDRGYWAPDPGEDPAKALAKGSLKFLLAGKRLEGRWVLARMNRREGEKRNNWLLIKSRDRYAVPGDADTLLEADRSAASGRTMAQIAAGRGRKPTPFMLAKPARRRTASVARTATRRAAPARKRSAPKAVRTERRRTTRARKDAGERVESGRVGRIPDFVEPQLCKLVDRAPAGEGWGHEVKLDGYRVQLRVERGRARLLTRRGLDWTSKFPRIAATAAKLGDALIDGEICAVDGEGRTDFAALQAAIADESTNDLVYFAFDLLFRGREDLRALPVVERKRALKRLLGRARVNLRYVEHFETAGDAVLRAACRMSLEGIISKRLDAPYFSGRGDAWTKAKCRGGQEVVIGGWLEEDGRLRSLLAGAYHDGKLVYIGKVGTGFGREAVERLAPKLAKVASDASPFAGANAPRARPGVRWARPKLVAEIEFAGWTGAGIVRQASFKGLREDKPATAVRAERPAPARAAKDAAAPAALERSVKARAGKATRESSSRDGRRGGNPAARVAPASARRSPGASVLGVTLSNPDKPLWPAVGKEAPVTKMDLARYYEAVSEWMFPHLKGRPCSIVRAPDGIGAELFFQRHAMKGSSHLISEVKVTGDHKPYIQLDRVEALIAAAQIAAVELHPWNSRPGDPETPGRIVFDLDPAPDVSFARVIEGAKELRERIEALGLVAFCKTTGGKGLHVVTPLAARRGLQWAAVKVLARELCRRMVADSPDRYILTMSKQQRAGKIFLDYLRNDRTSTAVAPLSPRARPGAPVSMPLSWAQVRAGLDPARYTLRSTPRLLARSDAWEDYDEGARAFTTAAKRLLREPPPR